MLNEFIRIWSEQSNNIVEKLDIKLVFERVGITTDMMPHVKGQYFAANTDHKVNKIDREFRTKDEARDHMMRSFEEFIEKYPEAKGFYRLDGSKTVVLGSRLDSEWGLKFSEK